MHQTTRIHYLPAALRFFAAIFVLGVYPLTVFWPSGWCWSSGPAEYLYMIIGLYATLGVFLWLAASAPHENVNLIAFTIWSSIVHASVMAVLSFASPANRGHLFGDVPALFIVAAVLGWLCPKAFAFRSNSNAA